MREFALVNALVFALVVFEHSHKRIGVRGDPKWEGLGRYLGYGHARISTLVEFF